MWKFDWKMNKDKWKMSKDKWIIVLAVGAIFMVLSFPSGKKTTPALPAQERDIAIKEQFLAGTGDQRAYESYLEDKVKEFLRHVDGVGTVDVIVVLKSSEEKVFQVDKDISTSLTDEQDSGGGIRKIESKEASEQTILQNNSGNTEPIVTKELKPAIAGIVISASGGASPVIKAEISSAMEALFDVPPHKIKVLKRVE